MFKHFIRQCRRHHRISFLFVSLFAMLATCHYLTADANISIIPREHPSSNAISHIDSLNAEMIQQITSCAPAETEADLLRILLPAENGTSAKFNKTKATAELVKNSDAEITLVSATEAKLLPDVPLSAEVQQQILDVSCGGDLRQFCVIMAIANKETYGTFKTDGIGDNGLSYGLPQINTKWHTERMAKYGYSKEDLFDPVKSCVVASDYVTELMEVYQESNEVTHFIFMMYNQGPKGARNSVKHGVYSTDYSRYVMSYYESYMAEVGLTP